jgi:uncharacterized protein (DUF2141 family)
MAFRFSLILSILLLLVSCAQIGALTGGDKDIFAPNPSNAKPPQGTSNFTENSVEFAFKEFVLLNNPQQNIFIVPADVIPSASLTKKTLTVSWGDSLKPNTTYVLYLNNAVKDVSEGNDSLMNYVFSTGATIDSITYQTQVLNSLTNEPVPNCLVGLFQNETDKRPYYFVRTNNFGEANFSFLKAGTYYVKAFKDEDKNMERLPSEQIAFRSEALMLDSSQIDSVPLRLFTPAAKKISTFTYLAPGCFSVGAKFDLSQSQFTLNGQAINDENSRFITSDSLLIFNKVDTISAFQLIAKHSLTSDTLSLRVSSKDKLVPLKLSTGKIDNSYGPHQEIIFQLNDRISAVDTSKIKLFNTKDTSGIKIQAVSFKDNQLIIQFKRTDVKQIKVDFMKGSILTENASLLVLSSHLLNIKLEKDFGAIDVKLSDFETDLLVQLYLGKEKVETIRTKEKHCRFKNLIPGDYSFVVVDDINNNGRWDTGDLKESLQPEQVYLFSSPSKVRANWEIQVELNANN